MHEKARSERGYELAWRDFRAARFTEALQRLAGLLETVTASPATLLLARIELRRGSPAGALQTLTHHGARLGADALRGEACLLKGVAFARLGDPESARAQFEQAETLLPGEKRDELIYERAAAHWIERDLESAQTELAKLSDRLDADLRLATFILRGAIASAREDFPTQGAILLEALRDVRGTPDRNAYLYAMLVTQIAALGVELASTELRDAAIDHIAAVPWTPDIGDLHFHAVRAIAWRHALEGDEFNAFRRLKEALAVTQSAAWRVAALADRAYLAAALGEARWAAQELRDAHELAATIDWSAIVGEEKLALPVLAELFASRDPSVAIHYAATFSNVGKHFSRILSSRADRRVEALEAYSLGCVQLELGDHAEAQRLLVRAWSIYEELGIRWRAARAALALARFAESDRWRAIARGALEAYPRSWLARETALASRSASEPARYPAASAADLRPQQQAVLDLLMQGCGTDEIAERLGRSTFTIRNHIKRLLKIFGVSSRAALVVKAGTAG